MQVNSFCPDCKEPVERAGNGWRCWGCKKLYFACQTCGQPIKVLPCAHCTEFPLQLLNEKLEVK